MTMRGGRSGRSCARVVQLRTGVLGRRFASDWVLLFSKKGSIPASPAQLGTPVPLAIRGEPEGRKSSRRYIPATCSHFHFNAKPLRGRNGHPRPSDRGPQLCSGSSTPTATGSSRSPRSTRRCRRCWTAARFSTRRRSPFRRRKIG